MKYTLSNMISKPLEEVVEKFKDPDGHLFEISEYTQTG